jgi:hypothetical protein
MNSIRKSIRLRKRRKYLLITLEEAEKKLRRFIKDLDTVLRGEKESVKLDFTPYNYYKKPRKKGKLYK